MRNEGDATDGRYRPSTSIEDGVGTSTTKLYCVSRTLLQSMRFVFSAALQSPISFRTLVHNNGGAHSACMEASG